MRTESPRLLYLSKIALYSALAAVLATAPVSIAQDKAAAPAKTAELPTYKAGGTPIAIPSPTSDLIELGDYRVMAETFVPDGNRLLAAFMLQDELSAAKGGTDKALTKYALVEVPRRGEFMDLGASDFKEMVGGASQAMGAEFDSSIKEGEDEFNRRMKTLAPDSAKVTLEKPIQLGTLFSKQDAWGCGLIMEVSSNGKTVKYVAGINLLRVKNRAIFAYLYTTYQDEGTVKWLRKASEDWADEILKTNQQ